MDLVLLKSGTKVEIQQNGEIIDRGFILTVSVWGSESIPKIEYKSTFLRLEGIIEFVYIAETHAWHFLVKNPLSPLQKLCHESKPGYSIEISE